MNSILKRIEELKKIAPDKLTVIVNDNGTERTATLDELEQNPNLRLVKVADGGNIKDIVRLLDYMRPTPENTMQ